MIIGQLRSFIVSLILARLLDPADFGLIGMAMVFNAILDAFVDFGFSNAIIRKEKPTEIEKSTVFYLNVIIGAICTTIVFFIAPLVAQFFDMPRLTNVVRVTSFSFLIGSLGTLQTALFQKSLNFKIPFKAKLISGVSSGILGVVMAFCGFGVWALVGSNLSAWILYAGSIWLMSKWRPRLVFKPNSVKDMWVFGWKFSLTTVISRFFRQMDTFVIGKLYSATSLGLFNRAQSLNHLVMEYSFSSIRSVMLPTLSQLQNDYEALRYSTLKLIHVISFLTFLFAGLMYICADDLIILLYGQKWGGAISLFKILGLFSLTLSLPIVHDTIMTVVNKMSLYLWIGILRNVLRTIAIPIGIMNGFKSYIWAVSIASVVGLLPGFYSAKYCIKLSVISQMIAIGRYLFPFIGLILVWSIIDYSTGIIIVDIVIKASFYIIFFVILNFLLRNKGFLICKNLLVNMIKKRK